MARFAGLCRLCLETYEGQCDHSECPEEMARRSTAAVEYRRPAQSFNTFDETPGAPITAGRSARLHEGPRRGPKPGDFGTAPSVVATSAQPTPYGDPAPRGPQPGDFGTAPSVVASDVRPMPYGAPHAQGPKPGDFGTAPSIVASHSVEPAPYGRSQPPRGAPVVAGADNEMGLDGRAERPDATGGDTFVATIQLPARRYGRKEDIASDTSSSGGRDP